MYFQVAVVASLSIFLSQAACGGGDDEFPEVSGDDNVGGVVADDDGQPIAGATLEVVGSDPLVSVTTNASGQFTLEAPEGVVDVIIEAPGFWGSLLRTTLGPDQILEEVEVSLADDAIVSEIAGALGRTLLETEGIVALEFDGPGEAASLSVSHDPEFTFDENGDPLESTVALGDEPELIFTGVTPGFVSISYPNFCGEDMAISTQDNPLPVRAKVISNLRVFCNL